MAISWEKALLIICQISTSVPLFKRHALLFPITGSVDALSMGGLCMVSMQKSEQHPSNSPTVYSSAQ
jgi:hypothetical protein